MIRKRSFIARVYGALAGLLPPHSRGDREEMLRAFEDLREDAPSPTGRAVVTARSLLALAGVVVVEWLEQLGVTRTPGAGRRGGRSGMSLTQDIRYAIRTLRRAPAFSITSLLLVGVGVGAVSTIFTLVDHVLLRPLP